MYRSPPSALLLQPIDEPSDDSQIVIVGLLLGLLAAGAPVVITIASGETFGSAATVALLFSLVFASALRKPLASSIRTALRRRGLRKSANKAAGRDRAAVEKTSGGRARIGGLDTDIGETQALLSPEDSRSASVDRLSAGP
jgi:hypothetical protein